MLSKIDQTRDAEARLLARVYSLILSWSDPDAQAEPRDAESPRVRFVEPHTRRAKNEVNDDDKK